MARIFVLERRATAPIDKEEWKAFWMARKRLVRDLDRARRTLALLEEADAEWRLWKSDLLAKLEAGAGIEQRQPEKRKPI